MNKLTEACRPKSEKCSLVLNDTEVLDCHDRFFEHTDPAMHIGSFSEAAEDADVAPVHQPKLVPPWAMYRLMEPEPSLYASTWLK